MFGVIDGGDSSGKKTQTALLAQELIQRGYDAETVSFPTYNESLLGILVSKYLKGEFGSKEDMTPEIATFLFAIDRYQFKETLERKIASGKTIIADRYTPANIYQAAKVDGNERFVLWEWIKQVESRLPQSDFVAYLDVPVEISSNLFSEREVKNTLLKPGEKDIYEADKSYLNRVRNLYLEIAEKENWIVINCVRDGGLKPREEINGILVNELEKRKLFKHL